MKIDFKKLRKVEQEYRNDHIALNTLQTMVDVILNGNQNSISEKSIKIAEETLTALGVLVETPNAKDPVQLNS